MSAPELAPLMSMTDEEYRRRFRGTPIRRAKRRGLLRNVAVALGNAADPDGIPALTIGLRDGEALVRRHAAWALGAIGGGEARDALDQALEAESDADVRSEIARALSRSDASVEEPAEIPGPASLPS